MVSSNTRTFALSAAFLAAVANALTVNTPSSLVQCQPVQLTWSDGTAPYYVSIIPGGEPSATALESFDTQSGTSYTWMVDLDAGQAVTVKIVDSTGTTNYSDQVTIQAGTSTTCSTSTSGSSSGSSSAAAAGSGSSGSSASAATTSSANKSSSSSTKAASSTGSSGSSSTSGSTSATSSTTSGVSSNSNSNSGAATTVKAGLGLLVGGLVMALAA